jgi:hypothetical protein
MWWLILIFVVFIFIILYNHFSHPFWAKQPVLYDAPISIRSLSHWKKEYELISLNRNHKGIVKYRSEDVRTISCVDISGEEQTIQELIKLHYIDPAKQRFAFSIDEWIEEHTKSVIGASLISLLGTDGMMVSKSAFFKYGKIKQNIYSVDWLVVHSGKRKQGVANKLIASHAHDVWRHLGYTCPIIFKREGSLSPVVPLVEYTAYMYSIDEWKPYKPIPITRITTENMNLIQDWDKLDIPYMIGYDFIHMKTLIQQGKFIVFLVNGSIHIFKNYSLFYNLDGTWKRVLFYVGSIYREKKMTLQIFKQMLVECGNYEYLILENLSHNYIVWNLLKSHPVLMETKMAYYVYNQVIYPKNPEEVMICV